MSTKDVERFWCKVQKGDPEKCWLWAAATNMKYGVFFWNGRQALAHRVALEIRLGRPVQGWALHTCDTPLCVNPAHLYEGSHQDNMNDAVSRDRHSRGSRNGQAVLTEERVEVMRHLRAAGTSLEALSSQFRINVPKVSMITRGETWKHAGGPRTPRSPRGHKIPPGLHQEIKDRLHRGESGRSIARTIGVSPSTVNGLRHA